MREILKRHRRRRAARILIDALMEETGEIGVKSARDLRIEEWLWEQADEDEMAVTMGAHAYMEELNELRRHA